MLTKAHNLQANIRVRVDAAAGDVPPIAIETTPAVGSFADTNVRYDPPSVEQQVDILWDFTANMPIDAVTLNYKPCVARRVVIDLFLLLYYSPA